MITSRMYGPRGGTFVGGGMAIGTVIMIFCFGLLVVVELFFSKGTDYERQEYSVYDDPEFDGLDGCGVIGYSMDDLNKELYDEK